MIIRSINFRSLSEVYVTVSMVINNWYNNQSLTRIIIVIKSLIQYIIKIYLKCNFNLKLNNVKPGKSSDICFVSPFPEIANVLA